MHEVYILILGPYTKAIVAPSATTLQKMPGTLTFNADSPYSLYNFRVVAVTNSSGNIASPEVRTRRGLINSEKTNYVYILKETLRQIVDSEWLSYNSTAGPHEIWISNVVPVNPGGTNALSYPVSSPGFVGSQITLNIRQSGSTSLVSNPFIFEIPSSGNKTTCPQTVSTNYINGKVSVNWDAQFGDSFKIERRLAGGGWQFMSSSNPNYFIDSSPAIGLANEYRISSNNSSLNCPMVMSSISL
ncbi:MAG: hypothetical protein ACI9IP_002215 [Arcticibacterium sp.]|jgi:hypothetical protein